MPLGAGITQRDAWCPPCLLPMTLRHQTAGPAWASGKGGCYQTKPPPADNNYKPVPEGTGEQPKAGDKGGESVLRK